MRRALKTTLAALAPVAILAAYLGVTLPPRTVALASIQPPRNVVYGAYHVHSSRSDGSGSVEEIAGAASRAGLGFVILTDHGDATRPPLPPAYLHGVLCLDAVEIGTTAGHLVALNLTQPSPYPLAGEPADVVEDVHRMGGFGIVAHPDSPKPELRWRQWTVPYDGVEWLNADSEWRDETTARLLATTGRYLMRPEASIASLFSNPVVTLRRWDAAARGRSVVALAGLDAHARIGWDQAEEPRRRTLVARPTYEEMFRTIAQAVVLDHPPSGDAARDAADVLAAITAGRAFSVVTAIAVPASLEFAGSDGHTTTLMGGRLDNISGQVTFTAVVPQTTKARLHLLRNGAEIAAGQGRIEYEGPGAPGAYRVEAYFPGWPVPWIVSNPIYVGSPAPVPPIEPRPAPQSLVGMPGEGGWTIERDPASTASQQAGDDGLRFAFGLGPGEPAGQYAALVSASDGTAGFDRVQFTARSDKPMRLSVQVRLLGGRDGQRWRRSVYIDQTARDIVIPLQDFEPVGMTTTQRPIVARVRAVLFVVDTLNTATGTSGTIWIARASLGVGNPDRRP